MKALVVTLMARHYGPAIVSRLEAIQRWEHSGQDVQIDALSLYGNPPGDSINEIVTLKYRQARETFLAGDYDVFIALEDDMIIPSDALLRLRALLDDGADLAYGLYVWRGSPAHWNAYADLSDTGGLPIDNMGDAPARFFGTVQDVAGLGMGCLAIKRPVLEALQFRYMGTACCDWALALDAKRAGFVQRCDLGLVCGHMAVVDEPVILWPDPGVDGWVRIESLEAV